MWEPSSVSGGSAVSYTHLDVYKRQVIDSVRDELKSTEIRELQLKYDKSITLRQNAEIRMSWYLTIAIGILIVIVLILLYFYSLKMYKKQKGKELSQQKQGSITVSYTHLDVYKRQQ